MTFPVWPLLFSLLSMFNGLLLIFTTICANVTRYLKWKKSHKSTSDVSNYRWRVKCVLFLLICHDLPFFCNFGTNIVAFWIWLFLFPSVVDACAATSILWTLSSYRSHVHRWGQLRLRLRFRCFISVRLQSSHCPRKHSWHSLRPFRRISVVKNVSFS
jgi:hypothetical protein